MRSALLALVLAALPAGAGADSSTGNLLRKDLGGGARGVFVEKRGDAWFLLARRSGGSAPPVELDALGSASLGELSVTVGRFLEQANVLEVVLHQKIEEGWLLSTRERHYLLREGATTDELACRFDGASGSSTEYHGSQTSAQVRKLNGAPLRFEVVYTTRASSHPLHGKETSSASSSTTRYTLPATGICVSKQ